jgi:hypothetical protein
MVNARTINYLTTEQQTTTILLVEKHLDFARGLVMTRDALRVSS